MIPVAWELRPLVRLAADGVALAGSRPGPAGPASHGEGRAVLARLRRNALGGTAARVSREISGTS